MGELVAGLVGHGVGANTPGVVGALVGDLGELAHVRCADIFNLSIPPLLLSKSPAIANLNPIVNEFVALKKEAGIVRVTSWT